MELPTVSVIIAVRNEANNIPALINQLNQLDYPDEKLEIFIGNDDSSDSTLRILQECKSPIIQIFDISAEVSGFKGKMNVLAQLIENASGEYLILTDADIYFDSDWVKAHVRSISQDAGLAGGMTGIIPDSQLSKMQHVDMMQYQGMLKVLIDLEIPIAAIGNNLIVKQSAINKVGGYPNIKPSIVEDVALLHVLKKSGTKIQLNYNPSTYIETKGSGSVVELLQQRRRWYSATKWVPAWLKLLIILKLLFLPTILLLIQFNPWFVLIFTVKLGLTYMFVNEVVKSIKKRIVLLDILQYELYEPLIYFSTFIYSLLPFKITWKGRVY